MHITIAEGASISNIGSMALIENAIKIARLKHPNCHITILSQNSAKVSAAISKSITAYHIEFRDDLFVFPKGNKINKIRWLLRTSFLILYLRIIQNFTYKPYKFLSGKKAQLLRAIANSEFIYCIGAERINDIYYKTAYLSLEALSIYEKMGSKLVHMSLTIGPVFYRSTKRKAVKVLNNSHAIFVRDQKSYDLLTKLSITTPLILNSYDIAILQSPLPNPENLLNQLGISPGFIGVSAIAWSFRKAHGTARQPEYNKALAETLDYIIEKYHHNIVFTPTVVGDYKTDDVEASMRIYELMKNKDKVIIIKRLLTPGELAAVFSQCKFSIVTRMHAAILCTAAGCKPIIAINYLYKLREYMKNIDFENYSIDIDYINTADLKQLVKNMYQDYNENFARLTTNIQKMRKSLLNDINRLANPKA